MSDRFQLAGKDYKVSDLNEYGRELVDRLTFVRLKLQNVENSMALLNKAKNGYIEDLKTEIIQERTGVDFSDIFSDD